MAVITTGSFAKLLLPGLAAIYGQKYNEYPPEWSQIFDKRKSKKAFEEILGTTGFGMPQVKTEGGGIHYDTMEQGFTSRFVHVTWALGFIITREMYKDNQYMEVGLNRAENLAFAMRNGKEVNHANILNRAFNVSYPLADGLEMCSTLHLKKSGGTFSNELATAADLSEDSLEQACIDIAAFTNDRGTLIRALPKALIIAPANEYNATRILKSVLRSDTAENDINAIRTLGRIPDVIVNHFLTSDAPWWIKTDVPHGLISFSREDMMFDTENDFDTKNARFSAIDRYVPGCADPRGIFGSAGG